MKRKYKYKINPDIYEHGKVCDIDCRFVLGVSGSNPIICFGVNPSDAFDEYADPTIHRIEAIAENSGHKGWIMLNLYPKITENPNKIFEDDKDKKYREKLTKENLKYIKSILDEYPNTRLLAAWGDLIDVNEYLTVCLKKILEITKDRDWYCRGDLTNNYNPRHPLFSPNVADFQTIYFEEGKAYYRE